MATVNALFPRVNMYAPGASEPLMQSVLELAANEFARDTWICQETLAAFTDADGSFTLTPTAGEGLGLIRLTANGYTVWSKWPSAADNQMGYLDVDTMTRAQPLMVTVDIEPLRVTMVPVASATQNLKATIAFAPTVGANNVPTMLTTRWAEPVVCKALERLLMMPNEMFTSPALAQTFANKYAYFRNAARIEVNRGYSRNGTTMSGPKFINR